MTDEEFDDWCGRANDDISETLGDVVDTEAALVRIKDPGLWDRTINAILAAERPRGDPGE